MDLTIEGIDRPALVLEAYESRRALAAWVGLLGVGRETAEDVVHEAFVRLLVETGAGRMPLSPKAWLHTVCRNLVVSGARHAAIVARHPVPPNEWGPDDNPEANVMRRFDALEVRRALAFVTPDARRALVLAAEGYSGAEIAAALNRSPEAIRTMTCRARARLREVLTSRARSW
jgi:RNA polymerase sigma factor (sigma-70 family)